MSETSLHHSGGLGIAALLAMLIVTLACARRIPQPPTRCTSQAQSSIAWRQSDEGAGEIVGRVVSIDGMTGIPAANVLLEPGTQGASTQADGSFRLTAKPGEYRIRVRSLGMVEARDSLFLTGRNSLLILVTLVHPDGDLREC